MIEIPHKLHSFEAYKYDFLSLYFRCYGSLKGYLEYICKVVGFSGSLALIDTRIGPEKPSRFFGN